MSTHDETAPRSLEPNTNGVFTSLVRTIVPLIVGMLVTWAAVAGFDIPAGAVEEVLYAVFTGLYYLAVRVLERQGYSWAGLLLGSRKTPEYSLPRGAA